MEIRPIHNEQDYVDALNEIDQIFDALPGTPEADRLEVLVTLVEAYEERNYPIPLPDPIEAIEYHMERLALTRKDLEPLIGSRSRVSEVLNRKRPLTIRMIRKLSEVLGIGTETLIQEYPLVDAGDQTGSQSISYPAKPLKPRTAPHVADQKSDFE